MIFKAISLGLRFILIAAIYLATVAVWLSGARGWKGLELFGVSIIFGIAATLSWASALAIGANAIPPRLRALAQPLIMVLLFLVLLHVVIGGLMGMQREESENGVSFAILIAAMAAADALTGIPLDRWVSRRTQGAR